MASSRAEAPAVQPCAVSPGASLQSRPPTSTATRESPSGSAVTTTFRHSIRTSSH